MRKITHNASLQLPVAEKKPYPLAFILNGALARHKKSRIVWSSKRCGRNAISRPLKKAQSKTP